MTELARSLEEHLRRELGKHIVGMESVIHALTIAAVARGHVLLKGPPGLGKTRLSKAFAQVLGGSFKRVQGTADLMPSDITGVHVFNSQSQQFEFQPGPLFADVVLVDEINRAGPKTQSALLEAMEERQVSVDRDSFKLSSDFLVIATMNPREFEGTFPLPESQLDRFMMKLSLGYPDQKAERALLSGGNPRELMQQLRAVISIERFLAIQAAVDNIHCSEPLLDYVQQLVQATRNPGLFVYGISPRAGLAIMQASRAWALMDGRNHAEPGDVQSVFSAIAEHRLTPAEQHSRPVSDLVVELLDQIAIP